SLCPPLLSLIHTPPTPRSTLFPYTTLFRSIRQRLAADLLQPHVNVEDVIEARRLQVVALRRHTRQPNLFAVHHLLERQPTCHERSEEHTSELQSPDHLVCRLLLEKKNTTTH